MGLSKYPPTLAEHLFRRQAAHPGVSGHFSTLIAQIDLAARIIAREINRAGLSGILGSTGRMNVQGEEVKPLDEIGNQTFIDAFRHSGLVCTLASEEMEEPFLLRENCPQGKYALVYDPVDGSSNIDVDITIGSIFAIRRGADDHEHAPREFLRPGSEQIAAGYVVYGPSTMIVYADDASVDGFTLDRSVGEFFLSHPDIRIPSGGSAYSVNEANYSKWSPAQQRLVDALRHGNAPGERQTARYVGSLVADFHRTLLQGGIYMYPGEAKRPSGKLRLLYEAAPLAFVVERAGGRASDGTTAILEKAPRELHERTPLFIGSADRVEFVERALRE
ncbi:MAG: class 1 fructose-bisphosphatase [Candidatus Eiseniibacteriota bacterium]